MKRRCGSETKAYKVYKNIKIKMSRLEFYDFCDLNKEVIMNFYSQGITPSINRIDSSGHYELNNIEIIPHSENAAMGKKYKKPIVGRNVHTGKLLFLDGSNSKKTNELGYDSSAIIRICKKRKNGGYSYKGYSWAYLEDYEKNGDAAFRLDKKRHVKRVPV